MKKYLDNNIMGILNPFKAARLFCLLLALVAGMGQTAHAQTTVTLTSSKATSNYQANTPGNYGTGAVNFVSIESGFVGRMFIEFDISSIPVGATISSAQLRLVHANATDCVGDTEAGSNFTVGVRRVTTAWTEGTTCNAAQAGSLTWTSAGATNWTTAGGDFNASDYATFVGGAADANGLVYTANVLTLVNEWRSGTLNYGLALVPQGSSASYFQINSDDATTATNRPQLIVTYTLLAPTITSVVTQIPCGGGNVGAINLTVTGGTTPYTYNWLDITSGVEPQDRTNLAPGTYNVTVTGANALSSTATITINTPSVDTDGDGYCNDVDLDDDNDGILDINECLTIPATQNATINIIYSLKNGTAPGPYTTGKTTGYVTTSQNFTTPGQLSFTAQTPGDGIPSANQVVGSIPNKYGTVSEAFVKITPGANEVVSSFALDAVYGAVDDGYHFEVNNVIVADFNARQWIADPDFSGASALFDTNLDGLWRPWTNEGTPSFEVDLVAGTLSLMVTDRNGVRRDALPYISGGTFNPMPLVNIVQGIKIGTAWSDDNAIGPIDPQIITFSAQIRTSCDTDQDGITDNLDTDSDNDGCADAIEGGGSFTTANIDGSSRLTGGVNANGVPTVATANGQTVGTSNIAHRIRITTNPNNVAYVAGASATFSVVAAGDAATAYASGTPTYGTLGNANAGRTYQWYLGNPTSGGTAITNGGVYSGATTATLNISNQTGLSGNQYCVLVSHSSIACVGQVRCATISIAPLSTSPLLGNTGCSGQPSGYIDLNVSGGVAPYTYDWADIPGTNDLLQVRTGLDAGSYTVNVTDNAGSTIVYTCTIGTSDPIADGANAIDLLGQYTTTTGFTNNYTQATANNNNGSVYALGFSQTGKSIIDTVNHRMFVTDYQNNRVLVFNLSVNDDLVDKTPDFVLGQANFISSGLLGTTQARMNGPVDVEYDATNNRLFVADQDNSRVLVYDVATITNGENAINVLGQANFFSSTTATTQAGMNFPLGLAYNATNNRLFVAQQTNRVTVYDVATITNGENAINVLGQPNFTSSTAANTQAGMNFPYGVVYDAANSRLFVAQSAANRVTVYDVATITNGENAINVLGQANFTSSTAATTQAGMNAPAGVAYDPKSKRLFVAQSIGNRITVYDVGTITDGENAINVLGQPNFTNSTAATTQSGLSAPSYMSYDPINRKIYVSEDNNNRILVFGAGPTCPVATIAFGNVSCAGGTNGYINMSVSGGSQPYNYDWSDIAGTNDVVQDRTALSAGTYTVTVTDAAGATAIATVTITQPLALTVTGVVTPVSCTGGGAIAITAAGGTGSYEYNWADIAGVNNPEDRAGIIPGSYSVTVTDEEGCTATASFTLTAPNCVPLPVCKSNTADVFSVAPDPDVVTYTWTVTGGGTIVSGQGTPSVKVNWSGATVGLGQVCCKTVNSCGESANICRDVNIRGPIAGAAVTTPACIGSDILLSGRGGVEYKWTGPNGFTANSIAPIINNATALNAGTYNLTVTDAEGCTATASVVLTLSTPPTATVAANDAGCGLANGAVTLTPAGSASYQFRWSNGATTQNLINVVAGAYTVTVTGANGCKAIKTANVSDAAAQTVTLAATNVACFGGNTGQLTPSVSGGVGPFEYFWSTGVTTPSATPNLTGLGTGNYQVTVTSLTNGCQATASATLTQPNELLVNSAITTVNCIGGTTGAINLTTTGGATPYTYNWGGGVTTEDRTGLAGGVYTVTITDANGCSITNTIVLTQPGSPLVATTTVTNVKCNGGSDGVVNLTASGGTLPYTYLWTGGATTEDISGKVAGTYAVTVTDAKGCTATSSKTVTQPTALSLTNVKTDVSCNGGSTGAINLTPTGGTTPLSISWSNGATTEDLTGLSAGTYGVTVTDANACTATASISITQPATLTATATPTNPTCNGGNGSIAVAILGGTTAYTYLWSSGQITQNLTNIAAGTYIVTVTDAKSCKVVSQSTITQPTAISLTSVVTNVACNSGSTGAIALTATNGVGALTYNWGGGVTSQNRAAIVAGTYNVTVTDANLCTASKSFIVTQPSAPLATTTTKTDAVCAGNADGSINLSVTGGSLPYTYNWSNGATTKNISSLAAGIYSVTVTDAQSCTTISSSVTITQPSAIVLSATTTSASCMGGTDGAVNLTASGGSSPYTYLWSNGATTQDISGITSGNYSVTVTGATGCATVLNNIAVSEISTLTITPTITNNLCRNGAKGAISLTTTGGAAPFTYNWSNGATTKDITGLAAGTYTIIIKDAVNCVKTYGFTITEPASGIALTLSAITTPSSCGASTGAVDLTPTGGLTPYVYAWSNSATTQDITNIAAGTYKVSVTDASGCLEVSTNLVNNIAAPTLTPTVNNALCKSATNGSITLVVSGGTTPYTYAWSNSTSAASLTGVGAGTYTVTVTAANGCKVIASNTITEPSTALSVSTYKNAPNCTGLGGEAFASPLGGTAPYTYAWSNSATTSSISNLAPATYNVTITDTKGCTSTGSSVITAISCLPPVAVNDNFTTPLNTPITQTVAPNDSDPDGVASELFFSLLTDPTPAQGTIKFDGTYGNFTFTPTTGFAGVVTLSYQVCDVTNLCTTGTLTITVTAAVTPVTESGTSPSTGGTPVVDVRNNDTVNGAAATSSNSTIAQVGVWQSGITLNTTTGAITVANGTTPGVYSVTYRLCDLATPTANCATVADTITVTASCNAGSVAPILIKN